MRAFHMPSLPEMPYEHVNNNNDIGQVSKMKRELSYLFTYHFHSY